MAWVTIGDKGYWRAQYQREATSQTDTQFNVPVQFGVYGLNSKLSSYSYTGTEACSSAISTPKTVTKTAKPGANARVSLGTTTLSFTRQPSAYNVTISVSIKNNSTGSTLSTSFTQSIPALASYAVSYNANGGTGTIANDTKYYGINIVLSDGTGFTKTNYTLIGWNTSADGTGTHYDLGGTYTGNAALTLYAEWELNVVQGKMKVNSSWEEGFFYIKVNGSWELPYKGYVKVNGSWEEIST